MRVAVGRVGKPHGLRGWVTILPTTDVPEVRFVPGAAVFPGENAKTPWLIEESSAASGRWLVRLQGCVDRSTAEDVRGTWLWAEVDPRESPADPDAVFDHQLIGLRVISGGVDSGEVVDVLHLPAQDVLVVMTPSGERLVPFVFQLVPEVDVAGGRLTVATVDGLLSEADSEPEAESETGRRGPADAT